MVREPASKPSNCFTPLNAPAIDVEVTDESNDEDVENAVISTQGSFGTQHGYRPGGYRVRLDYRGMIRGPTLLYWLNWGGDCPNPITKRELVEKVKAASPGFIPFGNARNLIVLNERNALKKFFSLKGYPETLNRILRARMQKHGPYGRFNPQGLLADFLPWPITPVWDQHPLGRHVSPPYSVPRIVQCLPDPLPNRNRITSTNLHTVTTLPATNDEQESNMKKDKQPDSDQVKGRGKAARTSPSEDAPTTDIVRARDMVGLTGMKNSHKGKDTDEHTARISTEGSSGYSTIEEEAAAALLAIKKYGLSIPRKDLKLALRPILDFHDENLRRSSSLPMHQSVIPSYPSSSDLNTGDFDIRGDSRAGNSTLTANSNAGVSDQEDNHGVPLHGHTPSQSVETNSTTHMPPCTLPSVHEILGEYMSPQGPRDHGHEL